VTLAKFLFNDDREAGPFDRITAENVSDDSIMPFGKHKGKTLGEIDASYLLWLADEAKEPPDFIIAYVKDKRVQLEQEVESHK
jgi:hypothetical protein